MATLYGILLNASVASRRFDTEAGRLENLMDGPTAYDPADWRAGVQRLVSAPHDLLRSGAPECSDRRALADFPRHRDLFAAYRAELLHELEGAMKWWEMMIVAETQRRKDHDRAVGVVERRTPGGPASNPAVIRVIRTHWLACAALNRDLTANDRLCPAIFLLDWLLQAGDQDTAKILARLPFWPLGLDQDGNWI